MRVCVVGAGPSRRHHLEVDYLRYERDLRRLLGLTGGREDAA